MLLFLLLLQPDPDAVLVKIFNDPSRPSVDISGWETDDGDHGGAPAPGEVIVCHYPDEHTVYCVGSALSAEQIE